MGIRINTNISSINTQRHLLNSTNMFAKSMEKLSSGLRINRAGDDAAGLAISEGLKSDLRALDQASRNAGDGISLVQVGEGSLDEVSNILLRMKELTEQSLNGTLSNTERGYLNSEFTSLKSEIDRISDTTEFNGVKLLDGSETTAIGIQVGIGTASADQVDIDLSSNMDASSIGVSGSIETASNATTAMGQIDDAIASVTSTRSTFGAIQNRLESSIRNINLQSENLAAANSRIRDVDVAKETSTLTSYQILQQAGVSMLAQAKQSQGLALALFQ